jgi:polyisoprenyl-phosphate glycosyltransferase
MVSADEMLAAGESTNELQRDQLIVLTPVYNDWEVLRLLLEQLDAELSANQASASVIAVDDGSQLPADFPQLSFRAIRTLEVLRLRRNLGHQRAIAVGLAYVETNLPCTAVVVMDADGEDQPRDVLRLVAEWRKANTDKVVFALRNRRSEGLTFRAFYTVYRWVFKGVTGQAIRFGNFSLIPRSLLRRLVAVSEIWNHYASGVQRAKVPCVYLPTDRGKRLAGHSKMNFVSLVTHGMSAMSVHAETIGTRMLVLALLLGLGIVLAMMGVIAVRLFTTLAIPGWATFVLGLLSLMLLQTFFIALFFAGTVLHGRNAYTFLPSRDHSHFVDLLELIHVTRKS